MAAFATSYIPTTTAAATRAADVAVMTGANFSNWYRQDEGTLFAAFTPRASAGIQHVFAISDGTVNNRMQQFRIGTSVQSRIVAAGVQTNPGTLSPCAQNENAKILLTYKAGTEQSVAALNAVVGAASSPSSVPVVTTFAIGQNHTIGNLEMLNGHIRKIAHFPRRLTNSELQGITS